MILKAAIPLLALALVLLSTERARTWARLAPPLRRLALIALAGTGAAFLLLGGAPSPDSPLEPFSLAAASLLVGCLILARRNRDLTVPALLGEAADAIVVGAAAGTLALLSRAPAASLGLLTGQHAQPTLLALSALAGLLVRCTLARATLTHVSLAACAWFSVASGLAAGLEVLPAMALVFLLAAGVIGSAWARLPEGAPDGGQPGGSGQGIRA